MVEYLYIFVREVISTLRAPHDTGTPPRKALWKICTDRREWKKTDSKTSPPLSYTYWRSNGNPPPAPPRRVAETAPISPQPSANGVSLQ